MLYIYRPGPDNAPANRVSVGQKEFPTSTKKPIETVMRRRQPTSTRAGAAVPDSSTLLLLIAGESVSVGGRETSAHR